PAAVSAPVSVGGHTMITGGGERTVTFADGAPPAATSAPSDSEFAVTAPGAVITRPAAFLAPPRSAARRRWIHAVPLALLLVAVFGTCLRDATFFIFSRPSSAEVASVDPRPLLGLSFDYNFDPKKVDK